MRISDWSSDVCSSDLTAAGRDPASLPSVFASTHGDLPIMAYMCAPLTGEPRSISPTKFHNSVHNAAAGYWTIGSGCMHASNAVSAFDARFAQGLVESMEERRGRKECVRSGRSQSLRDTYKKNYKYNTELSDLNH